MLLVDVRSMTANWDDCVNSDLDYDHVRKLLTVFEAGLNWMEEAHYIKASLTKLEWDTLLEFLAQSISSGNLLAPEGMDGVDTSSLEATVRDKSCVSSITSPSAVTLPCHLPVLPILEAGQHHKATLELLLQQQTHFANTLEGKVRKAASAKDEVYNNI